jgi:hypothetical protein
MRTSKKEGAGNNLEGSNERRDLLNTTSGTGVTELIAAGRLLAGPQHLAGRQPYVLTHAADGAETLTYLPHEDLAPLPDHIRQEVTLRDPESFALYVKRHQQLHTVLFATLPVLGSFQGACFTAIFDYHAGGQGEANLPARCAHRAHYPCPPSLPWATWLGQNGQPLKQSEFTDFIEANALEIVSPDSATLMEIALNFQAHSEAEFSSKIDRTSGAVQLVYQETIEQGRPMEGKMKLPPMIELRLPVFEGGEEFTLKARLAFSVASKRLTIAYHLQRPHDVFRQALLFIREDIAGATGLIPLTGAPKE